MSLYSPGLAEIAQSTIDAQVGPLPIKNLDCYQMALHKPVVDMSTSEAAPPVVKAAPTKRKAAEAKPSPVKRLRPEKMIKKRSPEKETTKPPSNLNPIISKLFDEFWDMELPPVVAIPFFSVITPKNCESLGMPGYFDKVAEACTFYNIKEKLEAGLYVFPETFEYDFMMCFDNVILYYPHDSPQRKKAIELRELFTEKWTEAKRQMK